MGLAELQGADSPLYLLGARLHGFSSILPLYSGCGLMFSASTYNQHIGLTFTSDRSMLPDPELMRECLDQTVAAVASYLKSSKRAAAKPATKTKSRRKKPLAA